MAAVVGLSSFAIGLAPAAIASTNPTDLKINEVLSDGTDFVELKNTGSEAIDLHGLKFIDGGGGTPADLVTETTLLAPGGYYSFEPNTAWGIGLGKGDSATILAADGTTIIDTITWPAGTHATPSFGRCADGTGAFVINTTATRDAANNCPNPYATIALNELRSNDSAGGKDFVELTNTGSNPIDLSALTFVDNDPAHEPLAFATEGTTLAPGAYFSFETDAVNGGNGYGLGKGDSVTILDGDTVVDTYQIPAGEHATPSVGRCPDGVGAFATTLSATPGAANDCPAVPGADSIKINEVNSDPDDWFELTNTGAGPVDVSGWRYSDSTTATTFAIPGGTIVPAGGFVTIPSEVGLGKGDSVHLYLADGLTQLDATTWPAGTHATSWGRFPDGTGSFQVLEPSANAANKTSGPVTEPPALDPNWDDIEINEMTSLNAGDPGNPGFADAVELFNKGSHPVTIEGWKQTDSGAASGATALKLADLKVWNGTELVPATTWVIEPGGYVTFSSKKGLSGEGDGVKIYGPEGASQLVDQASYGDGDAGVSGNYTSDARAFAVCPDGSDEFWRVTRNSFGYSNADACETKSRRFETKVVVNEVSNIAAKAELLNTGTTAEDISGWELVSTDGSVAFTVPANTVLGAGELFLADPVNGLKSVDSISIRNPLGASILAHTWSEDGHESYSRCDFFGKVSYVETPQATWGAANACPELASSNWPGPAAIRTADAADAFTDLDANDEGDVSGVVFDPQDPTILWAAMNKGRLFKMHKVGDQFEVLPEWDGGIPVRFTDGAGELDAEGVAVGPDGAIYLTSERDNARAKSVSANKIARFDVSNVTASTTELVATHQWDVNDMVVTGTNLGLEGIAYVPDSFLVDSGWTVNGAAYKANDYDTPGLFVAAVEATGNLHFFSLPVGGAPVEVKVERSGFPWSMDVAYDADRKMLWALCDDSCGGVYNTLKVTNGDFAVSNSYQRPGGMPNLNNEGMAIAPWSTAVDGKVEVVWADDGDTDGHSLRARQLELPPVDGPVVEPVKADSTLSAGAVKVAYGKASTVVVKVGPADATGRVQVLRGSTVLGFAEVRDGVARVGIGGRLLVPGTHSLRVAYLGSDTVEPSTGVVRVAVTKAPASVRSVKVSTSKPRVKRTKLTVTVRVASTTGVPATGKVRVKVGSKTYSSTVKNGVAKVKIPKQKKRGTKKLSISYAGSSTVEKSKTVVKRVRWR
ncbi:MAG: hypothetical protein GX678_07940 [Actinomycetales bacterium]|nr:hypothetical protein [Actinomycetales bacterium]